MSDEFYDCIAGIQHYPADIRASRERSRPVPPLG